MYLGIGWVSSKNIDYPFRGQRLNLTVSQLREDMMSSLVDSIEQPVAAPRVRRITLRTAGYQLGSILRLVSPTDIGRRIKPFVFVDYFDFAPTRDELFRIHPHSGIATASIVLNGEARYQDTTGASGIMRKGDVEWLQAGNGVWHDGSAVGNERLRGYQVWIALPPDQENGSAFSQQVPAGSIPGVGPARVLFGDLAGVRSPVASTEGITLLHVRLRAGKTWRFQPPSGQTVAWAHAGSGSVAANGMSIGSDLVVFDESDGTIVFTAGSDADILVGSAVPHPYDLVVGNYSVHTSVDALRKGEAEIDRIGSASDWRAR
ncbi:pirin family protein [Burkholderia pyrrocinia]|uniref:pirin family protein n=1 Tax=Burkholderia pyrrocinia TaxID=60550 RepID=UPI001FB21688|nr:pirin family protein [Burkholderia pyrrocinia]UOB58062.1 pirin family protein [Burkholderia pyrrocinia]